MSVLDLRDRASRAVRAMSDPPADEPRPPEYQTGHAAVLADEPMGVDRPLAYRIGHRTGRYQMLKERAAVARAQGGSRP